MTRERTRRPSADAAQAVDRFGVDEDLDVDDLDATELEEMEEALVDEASAAATRTELEAEVATLSHLEAMAKGATCLGLRRQVGPARRAASREPEMYEPGGGSRKLLVFTEHRDTLNYLVRRLRGYLGRPRGGSGHPRRHAPSPAPGGPRVLHQRPRLFVLVATDAAGEGINLQRAHLVVNYDLPWNPNRIEQRFGRVHRIGQRQVCHMWNLVATDTREGQVYELLLTKLEAQRQALGTGQVFDVLGKAFSGRSLRELLVEAVRYGDRPEVKAKLDQVIDAAVSEGIPELIRAGGARLRAALRGRGLPAAPVDGGGGGAPAATSLRRLVLREGAQLLWGTPHRARGRAFRGHPRPRRAEGTCKREGEAGRQALRAGLL